MLFPPDLSALTLKSDSRRDFLNCRPFWTHGPAPVGEEPDIPSKQTLLRGSLRAFASLSSLMAPVFVAALHLIELFLLIGCEQSANLIIRGFMNVHHL